MGRAAKCPYYSPSVNSMEVVEQEDAPAMECEDTCVRTHTQLLWGNTELDPE